MKRFLLILPFFYCFGLLQGQSYQTIELVNGSFEGIPAAGAKIVGWYDCGKVNFPGETPPDIQPFVGQRWSVEYEATDGQTYMGMVTRDGEEGSWEAVSQRLANAMQPGRCYSFSVDLMQSSTYYSQSRIDKSETINYITPIKIRLWGGNGYCQKKELLGESPIINHEEWKAYDFRFEPKSIISNFTIEAFYKTPTLIPYAGNVLLDNASHIQEIPCTEEPIVVAPKPKPPTEDVGPVVQPKPAIVLTQPMPEVQPIPRKKILPGLTKNNLTVGQEILVEELYFAANSSEIGPGSFPVLDEVYKFLEDNPNVYIEVGGHTNSMPPPEVCDKLSTDRAKEVASYLVGKGIGSDRVEFKGYGKRQPRASNRTATGRAMNQRVQIKILRILHG